MLQKIENLYLAILRFVVIAAAGAMLVAVVILGLNSLAAIQSEPVPKEVTPSVSDEALKKLATKEESKGTSNTKATPNQVATDPNKQFYDAAAQTITEFVKKHSGGEGELDKAKLSKIIKEVAEKYQDKKLTSAFAKNLAESLDRLLKDPEIIASAKNEESSVEVVKRIVDAFSKLFDEQIQKANIENAAAQREYVEKKAAGMQSIYLAGGAFGAFLMIVFLSIAIRIERNLRHLEIRSTQLGG